MCSLPAMGYDFDPPHLHSVVMTDLVILLASCHPFACRAVILVICLTCTMSS